MEIIKNLKYFYGLSGLIYKNNLFIEFLDIIDLIIKIPSFVHPLIAKLKLALLTKIDYFLTDIYYKLYVGYYPEVDFNPFSRIILHEINNIKDSELEEFEKKCSYS